MPFFGKKKKADRYIPRKSYDTENLVPVIKCSTCNSDRVAGFKNIHTGKIEEVMFIADDDDMAEFIRTYGLDPDEIKKIY